MTMPESSLPGLDEPKSVSQDARVSIYVCINGPLDSGGDKAVQLSSPLGLDATLDAVEEQAAAFARSLVALIRRQIKERSRA